MSETIDTIIVGAGPAGLSLSYYLTQQKREHLLLEQADQLADPWRNQRWDSFTLVTPNWMIRLPGGEYQGEEPDGFMPRDEVVNYLESYAASFRAPVQFGIRVEAVEAGQTGFRIRTNNGEFSAKNAVIATGAFQKPRIPAFSAGLPNSVKQLASSEYRNPAQLPAGAVFVAGSGQSGCQIAEELYQSGRKVYLSTGKSAGRLPRRYRGKDITQRLNQIGFFDRTVEVLKTPEEKFGANPQVSGKAGGHTLNLHQFARDGVTLLGRVNWAMDGKLTFGLDLKENLARMDRFEVEALKMIDQYFADHGIEAPEERIPKLSDGYDAKEISELDLKAAGISTVIWALGFRSDFSYIDLPIFDEHGYPIHKRGVTSSPGLVFLGLPWEHKFKSAILFGFGEDAEYIAAQLI